METAIPEDEAAPALGLRAHQARLELDPAKQLEHRRLHLERIRPALDHVAGDVIGAQGAAGAIRCVDHEYFGGLSLKLDGRRQSGDPGSHHDSCDFGIAHQPNPPSRPSG